MAGSWIKALESVKPYVFKVRTPTGSGTCFQISFREPTGFCGVATALHVVEHAHEWEDPIKLIRYVSGATVTLREEKRVIITYPDVDLAFILFDAGEMPIEKSSLPMIEETKRKKQGVEMGWCGFPAVAPNDLCFFTGRNSSWLDSEGSYLVDGVAINGISGGPAFTIYGEGAEICGVVSAYIPNRATGESLPGVCVIRDVAPYQQALQALKSLEEAREKEALVAAMPAQGENATPVPVEPNEVEGKHSAKKKAAKKKVAKKKTAKKKSN